MGRKNLKIDAGVFDELSEDKDAHQSWNDYLLELRDEEEPTETYENVKVHFAPDEPDNPNDDGYATVYDEVEVLPSGWVRCGSKHGYGGPQIYPPHRVEEVDAGYEG